MIAVDCLCGNLLMISVCSFASNDRIFRGIKYVGYRFAFFAQVEGAP